MGLLITEQTEDISGLIVESKSSGEKQYFIEGVFLQAEIKNRNGRKYARKMLEEEVGRYVAEKVNTNSAIGELGHPPTPTVSHERASHLITSLVQEGNNWIGKARILTSLPMGKIVKGLIDERVRFGVSSRGVGALKKQGAITEVQNFRISTAADVVTDPSAPDAWVQGIMEHADWVYDAASGEWLDSQLYENTIKTLDKPSRLISEETKIRLFTDFINSIASK